MKQTLSAAEARRISLAAQGFAKPRPDAVGTRQLNLATSRMGITQIDSVNVFARSHYMPYFSRLGPYDTSALDRLMFGRRGPYVEFWAHCAAFIPIEDWSLWRFRMEDHREQFTRPGAWMASNESTLQWVRDELAARGPLRPAEIEQDAHQGKRGPWWDWNVVKRALEHMWFTGEVAVAGRRGFERRYGLAEHVVPAEVLQREVPRDDAIRELIRRAARSYGVATAADLADYYRMRDRKAVLAAVGDLVDAGELQPVRVQGWERGGRPIPAWVHSDAALPRRIDAAAILTPFDPVVWFRARAERLFGFDYRIEIYTPAPKRVFGYYSLPVLAGDDVVGRVDLKADRSASTLLVQSAWWEPGAPVGAAERLAGELRAAAAWQGLEGVSLSGWGNAIDDLAQVMPEARRHERVAAEPAARPDDEDPADEDATLDTAGLDPAAGPEARLEEAS